MGANYWGVQTASSVGEVKAKAMEGSRAIGVKAMAMEGNTSEDSYARNSAVQNHNFHSIAMPRLEKAIAHLMALPVATSRRHLAVADLGCSYGHNTLDCALFILQTLRQYIGKKGHCAKEEEEEEVMEVQYFFSDLPSNDFNALFHALQPHLHQTSSTPKMYAAGVPGSFYGCLFPSSSLDFVVCSYSLHWLSQVPPSIIDRSSSSWNGGHTWIHKSTHNVLDAYTLQAKDDVRSFIKSRAYELKSGGVLFLFLAGSSSNPNKCSKAHHDPIWEIFDLAWFEMVEEGIITLEEMEMFNMPIFFLKEEELKSVLMEAPKFQILHIETVEDTSKQENFTVQQSLASLTSVTKPTVDSYLGTCKAAKLFDRIKVIALRQRNFSTRFTHSLVVASLQRL